MHRMLLQMEWQHLHLWIKASHSPGSKFSYFIFLLKSLMWWWGSPGQQISPARKGKKPVFGKSWGDGLGPGGGGEQQGTDGECSRLPYVIWVASLSWYLGEGDPKIGSERVALLAACFLSSAVGHLEGEKWACSYLMVTPPTPCSVWQSKKLPLPRAVQLVTTWHYTGHLAVGDKDPPLNAHRKTLGIAGSIPGQTAEVNVQTWG